MAASCGWLFVFLAGASIKQYAWAVSQHNNDCTNVKSWVVGVDLSMSALGIPGPRAENKRKSGENNNNDWGPSLTFSHTVDKTDAVGICDWWLKFSVRKYLYLTSRNEGLPNLKHFAYVSEFVTLQARWSNMNIVFHSRKNIQWVWTTEVWRLHNLFEASLFLSCNIVHSWHLGDVYVYPLYRILCRFSYGLGIQQACSLRMRKYTRTSHVYREWRRRMSQIRPRNACVQWCQEYYLFCFGFSRTNIVWVWSKNSL